MKRLIGSIIIGMLAMALMVAPASAGRVWCARDPIVSVGNTNVQIWVAIPEEFVPFVTDAVEVRIAAPKGLSRQVLSTDAGFNGLGERVKWSDAKNTADGSLQLTVDVRLKIDQGRVDKAFGKHTLVPVQAIVNVGSVTQTFTYASSQKNEFSVALSEVVNPTN